MPGPRLRGAAAAAELRGPRVSPRPGRPRAAAAAPGCRRRQNGGARPRPFPAEAAPRPGQELGARRAALGLRGSHRAGWRRGERAAAVLLSPGGGRALLRGGGSAGSCLPALPAARRGAGAARPGPARPGELRSQTSECLCRAPGEVPQPLPRGLSSVSVRAEPGAPLSSRVWVSQTASLSFRAALLPLMLVRFLCRACICASVCLPVLSRDAEGLRRRNNL